MSLSKVDKEASILLSDLRNLITSLESEPKCTFTLDGTNDYKQLLSSLKFVGVYLLEIRKPIDEPFEVWFVSFQRLWADQKYIDKWVPNINSKRVAKLLTNPPKEWVPLYIGRSHNICSRIKQHIDFPLERSTIGLKLRARVNIYGNEFRVNTIKINVKNYNLLMPEVEKGMQNKYNPITGR